MATSFHVTQVLDTFADNDRFYHIADAVSQLAYGFVTGNSTGFLEEKVKSFLSIYFVNFGDSLNTSTWFYNFTPTGAEIMTVRGERINVSKMDHRDVQLLMLEHIARNFAGAVLRVY